MSIALLPGQVIGTAPVTLYTATGAAKVVSAILTNPTGVVSAVTLLIKRAAGEVVPVLSALPMAGTQAHVATELMGQTLATGDLIMAMATVESSVVATLVVST